jgi:hypothetical protein
MTPVGPNQNVEAQYRSLIILWTVLFMSALGFLLLSLLSHSSDAEENPVITIVLIGFSLSNASLSFRFKRIFLRKSVESRDLQFVIRAYILALVLCGTSTCFGVLIHFITGSVFYYVAFGIGIVGMVLHFPKKQHLFDASFRPLSN